MKVLIAVLMVLIVTPVMAGEVHYNSDNTTTNNYVTNEYTTQLNETTEVTNVTNELEQEDIAAGVEVNAKLVKLTKNTSFGVRANKNLVGTNHKEGYEAYGVFNIDLTK